MVEFMQAAHRTPMSTLELRELSNVMSDRQGICWGIRQGRVLGLLHQPSAFEVLRDAG